MGHRVLYVEKSEYLRLYLDNLMVEVKGNEVTFPISDIQILVIDNYKSSLTVPLINKLTEKNVCTILCGIDHLPQSCIMPMNGNFAQSGNIQKQIQWDDKRKKQLTQKIIQAKIYNQIEVLKKNDKDYTVIKKIFQFHDEVLPGDPTNREGLAAKMYFRQMYGDDFIRFDEDVINAGLNYGYSIFRALIASILTAKGYLPNLGIFHRGKQNMFNLADDIIEVFRPIVDDYVLNNMLDDILFKKQHREELIQLSLKKVYINDRKQTIPNAMYEYIECLFKILENKEFTEFIFPLPYYYDI